MGLVVEMKGPDFINSVNQITGNLAGNKISILTVVGIIGKEVAQLHPALLKLRGHFALGAIVYLSGFPSVSNANIAMLESASGTKVKYSNGFSNNQQILQMQNAQTDAQQAQTIQNQMQSDMQKQHSERWKMMQDTQTKIFEIQQDVYINRAKTADKATQIFDGYIKG